MAIYEEAGLWCATDRVLVKAYDARLDRTYFNRSPQATMTQNPIVTLPMAGGRASACARHLKPEHLAIVIAAGN